MLEWRSPSKKGNFTYSQGRTYFWVIKNHPLCFFWVLSFTSIAYGIFGKATELCINAHLLKNVDLAAA